MKKIFRIVILFTIFQTNTSFAQQINNEIQTTADATYFQSPDYLSIEVVSEQISASAQEALAALDKKQSILLESLKKISANLIFSIRGNKIAASNSNLGNSQIKTGQPISVKRSILVETKEFSGNQSKIIDTILQSGQFVIAGINYSVRENNQPLLDAITQATASAKKKAETIAQSLGLTLGTLISADSNEEPEGEMLKEKMLNGENLVDYGDQKLQVVVTLKYAVTN